MRDAAESRTALGTAFIRALHRQVDDRPPVIDDEIALALLRPEQRAFIGSVGALAAPWRGLFDHPRSALASLRGQIAVRARYAEDALAGEVEAGAARYVVLAAGLDSFALRQPSPGIPVVEIDHPATQAWKRKLLEERRITVPGNLTFLPLDFERQALAEAWIEGSGPDFVSWMGATYYLSSEAIMRLLTELAMSTEPGSQLVFDYWSEPPSSDPASMTLWGTRIAVALQREPMKSFFEPVQIEALAAVTGWRVREHVNAEAQIERYLKGRRDGLSVPSFAHLVQLEH